MKPLDEVFREWEGTPFAPNASVKRAGVDCVHLAEALLTETGLMTVTYLPAYSCDLGLHADTSPLTEWLDASAQFRRFAEGEVLQPGDLLCFRFGRVAGHCGIYLGDQRFAHVLRGQAVMASRLDDPTYGRRWVATYRPQGGERV